MLGCPKRSRSGTYHDPGIEFAWSSNTFSSAKRHTSDELLSTWRSLLPILEDNPLAVCDARSVDPKDLVPADRVIPTRHGEVYYMHYNEGQKWCWLEKMKPEEPLVMLMYDTRNESQVAKCECECEWLT